MLVKIGFGGGCHWCTEAVFQSLKGVYQVDQGWIASEAPYDDFSEAVQLNFNPREISLYDLIEIHLLTHSSTSNHSRRGKYRSAVYYYQPEIKKNILGSIEQIQTTFELPIITQVLAFRDFKANIPELCNYYINKKEAPFCKQYISPKLNLLRKKYQSLSKIDWQ